MQSKCATSDKIFNVLGMKASVFSVALTFLLKLKEERELSPLIPRKEIHILCRTYKMC